MDNSKEFQLMLDGAIASEPLTFKGFDRTKNVQDQLQEMVELTGYRFTFYESFSETNPKCLVWHGERHIKQWYVEGFSMEQLWLAFVMKEKHDKIRDGERWTSQ